MFLVLIFQAVFREDMLRRDIEDLQKRYQVCEGCYVLILFIHFQLFSELYILYLSTFLCRQVSAAVRS